MKTKTRGLEPIVAAVLLILVAVVGAVLIYLWFAGYVTKATSQAETIAVSEKLKIEAAEITDDPAVHLYIRNLGGDAARIVHVYVLRPGSLTPVCSEQIDPAVVINPGVVQLLSWDLSCPIVIGFDYVVKIVTQKGTEFAVTVTAGS
jgi:hypothetical protein